MWPFFKNYSDYSNFDIFKILVKENIELYYRGFISESFSNEILQLTQAIISQDAEQSNKRISYIFIESIQNVIRHQKVDSSLHEGLIVLQRKENEFTITTGNYCDYEDYINLRKNLEKINKLEKEELDVLYREILANTSFNTRGGAGLGLIEIARKSGNKIAYHFEKITDKLFFFLMQVSVTKNKKSLSECYSSLSNIINLYKYFQRTNIFFSLTGIITHSKILYITRLFEMYLGNNYKFKNKFFSVFIEALQNIEKHATEVNLNKVLGKYACILISSYANMVELIAGNFIESEKLQEFVRYLEDLNSFSLSELHNQRTDFYLSFRKNLSKVNKLKGLGLAEIRLRTKLQINYEYHKFNEKLYFITLSFNLSKSEELMSDNLEQIISEAPIITIAPEQKLFRIAGWSYPENAKSAYDEILQWFEKNSDKVEKDSVLEINLLFFNSSTKKQLIYLFSLLEKIHDRIKIIFILNKNEDVLEFANELKKIYPLLTIEITS